MRVSTGRLHTALSSLRVWWLALSLAVTLLTCACAPVRERRIAAPVLPTVARLPTAETPLASLPHFIDITRQAGIRFQHRSARSQRRYLIETMGSGCAFLDADGDGWLDILLLNNAPLTGGALQRHPTLTLYHNRHDGTFADVTHAAGLDKESLYAMGVAVGDYDNDGREDFYVTCALGPGHLFHNEGNGRFRDVTAAAGLSADRRWGTGCTWVDYDHDGKLDLFVCRYLPYRSLADDVPCVVGEARRYVYCDPSAYAPTSCTLYHNEGGGRFRDVTSASGIGRSMGKALGVTAWDEDGDGWPDLFVANDTTPQWLLHNRGNGMFKERGLEAGIALMRDGTTYSGMGIDLADAYNDGSLCLLLTNFQGRQTQLFHRTGSGLFQDEGESSGIGPVTTRYLGFGAFFFDYDNDGRQDILQVNGHVDDSIQQRATQVTYAQPTLLFRNRGGGKFEEVGLRSGPPFDHPLVGRGCAWGDIDNDGRLDVLIVQNNGSACLWRNATPTPNHWLTLKLMGVKSNRDGIGARVTVSAGGVTQRATVRSGFSYCSQSDLRPHFGLGAQRKANITIRWPSGAVDTFRDIPCDRFWSAREGRGQLQ